MTTLPCVLIVHVVTVVCRVVCPNCTSKYIHTYMHGVSYLYAKVCLVHIVLCPVKHLLYSVMSCVKISGCILCLYNEPHCFQVYVVQHGVLRFYTKVCMCLVCSITCFVCTPMCTHVYPVYRVVYVSPGDYITVYHNYCTLCCVCIPRCTHTYSVQSYICFPR